MASRGWCGRACQNAQQDWVFSAESSSLLWKRQLHQTTSQVQGRPLRDGRVWRHTPRRCCAQRRVGVYSSPFRSCRRQVFRRKQTCRRKNSRTENFSASKRKNSVYRQSNISEWQHSIDESCFERPFCLCACAHSCWCQERSPCLFCFLSLTHICIGPLALFRVFLLDFPPSHAHTSSHALPSLPSAVAFSLFANLSVFNVQAFTTSILRSHSCLTLLFSLSL